MQDVLDTILFSLKKTAANALKTFANQAKCNWLKTSCSQSILLAHLTLWVSDVEEGIQGNCLPKTLKSCISALTGLTKMVRDANTPIDIRMKVTRLITMDSHGRDRISVLIDERV